MKKTLIALAALATIAAVTPAFALTQWELESALQNYQTNMQLQNLMNSAIQANQAAVNRGLNMLTPPPAPYYCAPASHQLGMC
jgi:hypothetical protein